MIWKFLGEGFLGEEFLDEGFAIKGEGFAIKPGTAPHVMIDETTNERTRILWA